MVRSRLALFVALLIGGGTGTAFAGNDAVMQLIAKAASDSATRTTLVREGDTASFFCKNCHGEKGIARYPEVPNLASQNPAYIVSQIDAFLSGRRRNEFMQGLMKVLGDREKAAIALFYANQPATPAVAPPPAAAAAGASHYKRLCVSCHQADGHGTETFARIAGQQPAYLRLSLKRYLARSGERTNAEMSASVGQLGEANIEPVVQYLASLK
ncbi:c-type cytochrome [Aromatoleum petrolei]|uniref:C-type cytochrome n=1 Tax=Aromatoleum petrolei TaxID=76116 RepID=A0ABX1MV32_9RHOO|nr:c-type cytochrome [Aromatoleum petrolei]NMF89939.1 c-type cytochrome [Aromatoleum petrolei]QTQ36428.1 Cytochrome c4-like domain-containing protein [Aromatoleum petrolei]